MVQIWNNNQTNIDYFHLQQTFSYHFHIQHPQIINYFVQALEINHDFFNDYVFQIIFCQDAVFFNDPYYRPLRLKYHQMYLRIFSHFFLFYHQLFFSCLKLILVLNRYTKFVLLWVLQILVLELKAKRLFFLLLQAIQLFA